MTPAEYWERRNRQEAQLWLDEIGIGRPVKKPSLFSYVLLISVWLVWSFDVWQAVIEVCN